MSIQGGIVLGIAALAVLYFGRKVCANLGRKGARAGCCCEGGGGRCGKAKLKS
jgi:hypothetical protein